MSEIDGVFLATNGWLALLNSTDTLHDIAVRLWGDLGRQGARVWVTDWVIAETGNGLARSPARNRFAEAVRRLESSPRANLIEGTPDLRAEALELYSKRRDKTWGLVDCASFLVMRQQGIAAAFTGDRHFKQAGFRRLLPGP